MKLFLGLSFVALTATSTMAETNALECEVLSDFFELYQEKARVADADLMELLASVPLVFETESDDSELEAKLREKGYDPDKLVVDSDTIRSFTTLMRDRCGR